MIIYKKETKSKAEALVNTINTQGVMGKASLYNLKHISF